MAFSNALDDADRSDRVIAEAWDASFALFDGVPSEADLDRLEANLPKQEAGRYSERELVISRSNKSVRPSRTSLMLLPGVSSRMSRWWIPSAT